MHLKLKLPFFYIPRNLTLKPHYASFDRNTELAHFIHGRWKSYGFDAKIIKYNVLLSFPMEGKTNGAFLLNGSGEIMYRTAEKEKVLEPSEADPDVLPPFNAYSATGKAKVMVRQRIVIVNDDDNDGNNDDIICFVLFFSITG